MQRILLDTDPGVDDAQAILMVTAHADTKVEAIFTVGGNVGIEHTTRNALTIVEAIEQDIPVYAGCESALVFEGEDAALVHGNDGLGDSSLRPKSRQVEPEFAPSALIRMVTAEPDEFTLVAIGPLTNIALALRIDPTLPEKVKRFVVMGGAVTGQGNTSNVAAEFNIFADPEAAHIVFEAWGQFGRLIELVDWEATIRYGIPFERVEAWRKIGSTRSNFFDTVSNRSFDKPSATEGRTKMFAADPLALAVVVEPSCVTHAEDRFVMIETGGLYARGQTIVDWNSRLGNAPNARIVLKLDAERFYQLFEDGLK